MQNGDSWDESRKFVLNELERLGNDTSENTKGIGLLNTKVAMIAVKVSLLGSGGCGAVLLGKYLIELLGKNSP